LGIRDPALLNLAMGEMVWRLIIGKVDWWKKVFWKKYFIGSRRKRCIEGEINNQKGSHV
jgi:hypothetical protein